MKVIQALSILKPECNTEEALKLAYRKQSKRWHPDTPGGDVEMMQVINAAYELLKIADWTLEMATAGISTDNLADDIKEKWDTVRGLAGITGEIIGTWIWVSGNTKEFRKIFKEAGFKWSKNKVAWYWHPDGYKKWSKKKFGMGEIRTMFGSDDLQGGRTALA